jgi:DNA repair ATPase RecN
MSNKLDELRKYASCGHAPPIELVKWAVREIQDLHNKLTTFHVFMGPAGVSAKERAERAEAERDEWIDHYNGVADYRDKLKIDYNKLQKEAEQRIRELTKMCDRYRDSYDQAIAKNKAMARVTARGGAAHGPDRP